MSDLKSVLNDIMNEYKNKVIQSIPKMTQQIAIDLEPQFKEIVSTAIDGFYMNAQPKMYDRTGNFDSIKDSVKVSASRNEVTIHVGEENMSSYPGMFGQALDSSTAFDYFYLNGEHGHGKWNIGYSYPPFQYVEDKLNSIEVQNVISNSVQKILDDI